MIRAGLVALALALLLAPAAAAQDVRTFDEYGPETPVSSAYAGELAISGDNVSCTDGSIFGDPESTDPADMAAFTNCGQFTIGFEQSPKSQVSVQVWTVDLASAAFATGSALDPANVTLSAFAGGSLVATDAANGIPEGVFAELSVAAPGGAQSIDSVVLTTDHIEMAIDDLSFAPAREPDTAIGGGPSGAVASRDAAFTLASTVDGSAFECSLDGAPFAPCGTAVAYSGLADGPHTLSAQATDPFQNVDATPAVRAWTVAFPVPPVDPDGDGVPADRDNCPAASNPGQADEDDDAIGNECELLPSGSLEPVAGLRTTVEAVAGQVFVRLPAGSAAARAAQYVPLKGIPASGQPPSRYVPLQGIASIPVGSTIDSRKGQVAMTSSATFPRPGNPTGTTQSGRFAAAIFTIKQARRRRADTASRPATDLVLATPPGAARACGSAATRPPKGIVRTLTGAVTGPAKGTFRAVGAASTTTVGRSATWITQDRCNGTLTEVGRGRVRVTDPRARTTVTVRAGQAYRARALLFAAKRRRLDS